MNLQKEINTALLKKQEERKNRERSGKWSPSSFGYCFRRQYWNRKNEPVTNPPDVRSLRLFKAGDLFHDFVQGFIPDTQCEVKVETEEIFGYADVVTEDCVFDIKSQHSRAFWYMEKSNYDINKEREANILQVICYAWLLNKPMARLVFISKDDLCIAEYGFSVEKWKDKLKKELSTLHRLWNEKETPPAEPRAYNGKECRFCPYLDKCSKMEGEKHPYVRKNSKKT